jgi:flagellar assembly protein FliH
MSNLVPKGELSAFQRWEMTSFNEEAPVKKLAEILPVVASVSQEETAQIKENARLEGYALGYQEAYAAGLQEGKNDGFAESKVEMDAQIADLRQISTNMSEQMRLANLSIGEDLLNLAIELAQAMTKSAMEIDRGLIIQIVRDAIEKIPSIQQPAQLSLHPDDATIIRNNMGEDLDKAGWRIMLDPHMQRGGCKLETAHNLIDATIDTRWQLLTDALRRNTSTMDQA